MDAEAARPLPAKRSCRCLDAWLVASAALFYACLLGGVVYAALNRSESPAADPLLPMAQRAAGRERHIDSVTYLLPQNESIMNNSVVNWTAVYYKNMNTLGSFYEYNSSSSVLKVKKEGSYLFMVSLSFLCSHISCKGAQTKQEFTLSISCKSITFECKVDLSEGSVHQCVDILMLPDNCELQAHMKIILKEKLSSWKLNKNASKFGIVLLEALA